MQGIFGLFLLTMFLLLARAADQVPITFAISNNGVLVQADTSHYMDLPIFPKFSLSWKWEGRTKTVD